MSRPILVTIIAGLLVLVLACGSGVWSLHYGLVPVPAGTLCIGPVELMAVTEVYFSSDQPTQAYYTAWLVRRKETAERARVAGQIISAHKLIRLPVPVPTPSARRMPRSGARNLVSMPRPQC